MKFFFVDPETEWEYQFDFDSGETFKPGFMITVFVPGTHVGKSANEKVQIHRDPVTIIDGKPEWHEWHIREQDPLTSASARAFAQRIVNNLIFM